jgi:DNA-binding winged helix-turn-helix (wHTH) protein/tetratricopeptide (TPR) repeat protein
MQFLDYVVDTEHRAVTKAGRPLKLSSLNFELLRYFLDRPGQIISRNELMEQVWVGKVVSDATVYKQVQRLKQELLDEQNQPELIQTIHGQGFMLATAIKQDPAQPQKEPASWTGYLLTALAILLVTIVVYQLMMLKQDNQQLSQAVQKLAILYQSEAGEPTNEQQAIARTLHSRLLLSDDLYSRIETAESQQQFKADGLRLRQTLGYDHLMHVQVNSHDNGLNAHVLLQRGDVMLPDQLFEASNLLDLTDQIAQWTSRQLNTRLPAANQAGFTTSPTALEYYLQGMQKAIENDQPAAIEAFELALTEDPTFVSALYQLGVRYRITGQVNKGLEALNRIDLPNSPERVQFLVFNARANIHYRLGAISQAIEDYQQAIDIARQLQDQQLMISPLVNQAFMYSDTAQVHAARNNLEEALLYTDKDRQHSVMASIYNALASLYQQNLGDLGKALQYIEASHDHFLKAGNPRYAHVAMSKWADILIQHARFTQAREKLQQVLDYSAANDEAVNGLYALKSLIFIEQLYGEFNQAEQHLQQMAAQLTAIDNAELNHHLQLALIRQARFQQNFDQAGDLLSQFSDQLTTVEQTNIRLQYHQLYTDWLLQTGDVQSWSTALEGLSEQIPTGIERTWLEARLRFALSQTEQSVELLDEVIIQAADAQRFDLLIELLNTQIDVLLTSGTRSALLSERLQQLQALQPPPFPHLWHQARHLYQQGKLQLARQTLDTLREQAGQWWSDPQEQLLLQLTTP